MDIKIVGGIKFKNQTLPVYGDLNEPLFKAGDVADLIGYSEGNVWKMLELCDEDRKFSATMWTGGQRRNVKFVTETGLYDILAQSRKPLALVWRHVIIDQLVAIRKQRGLNIIEQFDEWDHLADNIYFDEEKGCLMRSVTVHGGDVEQVPYVPGE